MKKPMKMLEGEKSIGAGAATIALAGAAVGIGNVFSSLMNSVARNECKLYIKFQVLNLGREILIVYAIHDTDYPRNQIYSQPCLYAGRY